MHSFPFPKSMTAPARALVLLVAIVAAGTKANAQPRPRVTDEVRPFIAVDAPMVALTHVRLIDGTGAAMSNDQTIVIDGTRISTAAIFERFMAGEHPHAIAADYGVAPDAVDEAIRIESRHAA